MRVWITGLIVGLIALAGIGCSGNSIVDRVIGPKPISSVRMMEDANSPDHRRQGILQLAKSDFGRHEPYTKRYRQIAQSDPDFTVRAAAVRALNWARDKEAVPVFIAAMADANELVRWQAAKALSNVPDASAVDALTRAVGNGAENKDVRMAAAKALRHYRTAPVARALVATLNGKDFGVAWHARRSLRDITGQDFRFDDKKWAEYLAGAGKTLG